MRKLLIGAAAGLATLGLVAGPASAQPEPSFAEIASGDAATFSTLVAALDAADLVDTMADCSAGPFTVFAPTNDAFAAALSALGLTAEQLLADTETLTDILLYHVVAGEVMAADVVGLDSATTLQGSDIAISVEGAVVYLNDDVTVTGTDIEACNGVIHVIDGVLLPPADTVVAPLPDTGSNSNALVGIGVASVAAGGLLVMGLRRRRTVTV